MQHMGQTSQHYLMEGGYDKVCRQLPACRGVTATLRLVTTTMLGEDDKSKDQRYTIEDRQGSQDIIVPCTGLQVDDSHQVHAKSHKAIRGVEDRLKAALPDRRRYHYKKCTDYDGRKHQVDPKADEQGVNTFGRGTLFERCGNWALTMRTRTISCGSGQCLHTTR
jgi:hypothetical protein